MIKVEDNPLPILTPLEDLSGSNLLTDTPPSKSVKQDTAAMEQLAALDPLTWYAIGTIVSAIAMTGTAIWTMYQLDKQKQKTREIEQEAEPTK